MLVTKHISFPPPRGPYLNFCFGSTYRQHSTHVSKCSTRFPCNTQPSPAASEAWQCQQRQPGESSRCQDLPREAFQGKESMLCTAFPGAEEELNAPRRNKSPAWGTTCTPLPPQPGSHCKGWTKLLPQLVWDFTRDRQLSDHRGPGLIPHLR